MMIAGMYDFNNWQKAFMEYLVNEGYSPSVTKDYTRRIVRIVENESITIQTLSVEMRLFGT